MAQGLDYTQQAVKNWGTEFLRGLLEEPPVKGSGLEDLFRDSAERTYWTSFTDDSGYISDGIGLMALKQHWLDPVKRPAIIHALDRFFWNVKGNWIVRKYVKDLSKEIGMDDHYK